MLLESLSYSLAYNQAINYTMLLQPQTVLVAKPCSTDAGAWVTALLDQQNIVPLRVMIYCYIRRTYPYSYPLS